MTKDQAMLISSLLYSAGWVDDCDELINDMLHQNTPIDNIRRICQTVDQTWSEIAVVLNENKPAINAERALNEQFI